MPPASMLAMAVDPAARVLRAVRKAVPQPATGEVLVRVRACGVCRTDLHILDGELPPHRSGVVPGHEVVGEVVAHGPGAQRFALGQRVGIPWLGLACGHCPYCAMERENLCDAARFTGYQLDGGYATHCLAHADFVLPLPDARAAAGSVTSPRACAAAFSRAVRTPSRSKRCSHDITSAGGV